MSLLRTLGAIALLALVTSPALARPKVGLVLSGGGARGVAHIGVLKVLEEMRVPVDYVVGTSMGSIVAGAYAMGNDPNDLAKRLHQVNWNAVLGDSPPRLESTPYTKANDRNSISSRELGFRDAQLKLPRGLNYGQQIEFFFNTLAVRTGEVHHFDQLDIPFRAVATDIETGKMVVLDHGGIARAMRASMSVPGIFAPVEIDGRALLDGGLVRNLPVDVARSMGADIVIAVNLGTALLKRDQIVSVFGVGQQMLNILTEQNVETSLRQMTERDVLILPALGEYSAADFENSASTIAIGETAARASAAQLEKLSLDPAAWRAHLAHRKSRHPAASTVNAVRVDGRHLRHVSTEAVQAKVTTRPGPTFSMAELQANLNSLYASGDFQNVNHRFEENESGGRTLVIEPVEKEWGPNYLRGGFRLSTDLEGESDFSILLHHRSKWLNRSGLEWRNDVSLGQVMSLHTQLYQPFDAAGDWFVSPTMRFTQSRDNLIVNERPVATYQIRQRTAGVDLGRHLDNATTLRIGVERGTTRADPSVALPSFESQKSGIAVVKMEFVQDRFDDWVFPSTGTFSFANARVSSTAIGADSAYRRLEAGLESVWGFKSHRFNLAVRGGRIWGDDAPVLELFSLGGVLNMSGYPTRQFIGEGYGYARLMYSRQMEVLGLKNLYLGSSFEAGRISRRFNGAQVGTKYSGSVFGALNTGLGPFTLGAGLGEDGHHTFYLFFGKP